MYSFFKTEINKAADKYIPKSKICSDPLKSFTPRPYWDVSLSKAVAERRLALSRFRRNPTPDNLIIVENKVKDSQTLIKKAKRRNWQKFCSEIDEKVTVINMWQRMCWVKGIKYQKAFHSSDEKKEELLCSLAPDSALQLSPDFSLTNDCLESDFTIHELNNCLKKKDTTPGEDNISFSMI